MTRYRVEFDGRICNADTGEPLQDEDAVQAFADSILQELTKLAARKPALSIERGTAQVKVGVSIKDTPADVGGDLDDVFLASMAGFTLIRTAVHAAGLGTPGWHVAWFRTTTEPVDEALGEAAPEVVPT